MRILVIVNPRAGAGAGARRSESLAHALRTRGAEAELVLTRGPGDASRIARDAIARGFDCLGALGGDGTLNEVVQAYVDAGEVRTGPDLAVFPAGTGGDFRKTFGVDDDLEAAVARVVADRPRAVDLGLAELSGHDGRPLTRAFLNVTSFGLGGLTDRIVNDSPKWLGGKATFFLGAVRALAAYRNAPVILRVDGRPCLEAPILNVAVANGRYFGGGMKIAPEADPSDGLLDVVAIYDLTRAQGLGLAYKIYRGTHPGSPGVRVARGSRVEALPARPNDEILIDMDGETPGRLPLRIEVVPGALRLRV